MRVALINPRFRLPIDTRTTPHLGLAYLAAMSEQRGDEGGVVQVWPQYRVEECKQQQRRRAEWGQDAAVGGTTVFSPGLVV